MNLSKCIKMNLNDEEFEEGEIDERQNQDEDEHESETDKLRRSIDEKFNTLFSILNEIVII